MKECFLICHFQLRTLGISNYYYYYYILESFTKICNFNNEVNYPSSSTDIFTKFFENIERIKSKQ